MEAVVSVVIACRDAAGTLAVQLDALCRQRTSVPFEVLVCDNGSRDGTVALARSYADRLSLTVVDASARPGPGFARNVGARFSTAPLLVFCDADDEVADDWLEAMVTGLRRDRFVAGRFDAERLNPPGVLRTRPLQQSDGLQHSPFGPDLPHAGAGNLGIHRTVFLAVGGFDPAVGCLEDTDLCWRVQRSGVPLVFRPDAVLHVRLRSSWSGMWRQGLAYGEAAALLTRRYAGEAPVVLSVVPPREAAGWRARPRAVVRLVAGQRSLGGLLWTLGWHVGHRRRPVVPPMPEAVSGSAGPAAAAG